MLLLLSVALAADPAAIFSGLEGAPALATPVGVVADVRAGPLGGAAALALLDDRRAAIDGCYASLRLERPDAAGTLVVDATFGADGALTGLAPVADTLGDVALVTCVSGALGGLRAPAGSAVRYAFTLVPPVVPRPGAAPLVLGTLDKSAIDAVIRSGMGSIQRCYHAARADTPALEGRLTVKFAIAGDGAVSSAEVTSSTLGSPSLEACVAGEIRRLRFPAPDGGPVVVSYPFLFRPS